MRKFALSILTLVYVFTTSAQNEGNIWYFGDKAGIDFNSGSPVAIFDSKMDIAEGCASICDTNGDLLFYTNGVTVWDKNHNVMPNGTGLKGNDSSTQSALIVKKPGSNSIYCLFTSAKYAQPDGVNYYEVDMTNGIGVVSTVPVQLASPACEKIAAIRHQNGVDVWIVIHLFNSNEFQSYKLTSTGLVLNATIPIGVAINPLAPPDVNGAAVGYLKASQDGSRIASANHWIDKLEVFDFDNATGRLSNVMTFGGFNKGAPYGVEFSPNGNLLYASDRGNVYQYDLSLGNQTAISNARIVLGTGSMGALQLAPDGKIYHVANGFDLDVINNPDVSGSGCNFVTSLLSSSGRWVRYGLPNFINDIFTPNFLATNLCFDDATQFTMASTANVDSVLWNFDDPNSGVLDTSTNNTPTHQFSSAGTYNVTLTAYIFGNPRTKTLPITINPLPVVDLGSDITLCPNKTLELDVELAGATYVWQDGSMKPDFTISQAGTYGVEVTIGLCKAVDSIKVGMNASVLVDLGNDTTLCDGQTLLLNAGNPNATFLWQDGSTKDTLRVNQSNTYSVDVTNSCGTGSDEIVVKFLSPPLIYLGNDTTLCPNETLVLNAASDEATYRWQDGSIDPTFKVFHAGIYGVSVVNKCGTNKDTIEVTYDVFPEVNLGSDTSLCDGEHILLNAAFPNATYSWLDGSADSTFNVTHPDTYGVVVTNNCGDSAATITIDFIYPPIVRLGNDTTLCTGDSLLLSTLSTNGRYNWQDGSLYATFTVTEPGIYSVEVTNSCFTTSDTIKINYLALAEVNLGNDIMLCEGKTVDLDATAPDATYSWQDNSIDPIFEVTEGGSYFVVVTNYCGSVADSITVFDDYCNCAVYIPNAFTPNGDGLNDSFAPQFSCEMNAYELFIFNRWGEVVFNTKSTNSTWDGTYKGLMLPIGVYAYRLEYVTDHFISKKLTGHVNIIK